MVKKTFFQLMIAVFLLSLSLLSCEIVHEINPDGTSSAGLPDIRLTLVTPTNSQSVDPDFTVSGRVSGLADGWIVQVCLIRDGSTSVDKADLDLTGSSAQGFSRPITGRNEGNYELWLEAVNASGDIIKISKRRIQVKYSVAANPVSSSATSVYSSDFASLQSYSFASSTQPSAAASSRSISSGASRAFSSISQISLLSSVSSRSFASAVALTSSIPASSINSSINASSVSSAQSVISSIASAPSSHTFSSIAISSLILSSSSLSISSFSSDPASSSAASYPESSSAYASSSTPLSSVAQASTPLSSVAASSAALSSITPSSASLSSIPLSSIPVSSLAPSSTPQSSVPASSITESSKPASSAALSSAALSSTQASSTSSVAASAFIVHYFTEWTTANLHYRRDAGTWTTAPGESMAADTNAKWYKKELAYNSAALLEFCFNNGSTWDSRSGANYKIYATNSEVWVSNTIMKFVMDHIAPVVTISDPYNGANVNGTVTLSATATDNYDIALVEFYLNGSTKIGDDTSAPYSISWNSAYTPNGTKTITAIAIDGSGNRSSNSITVYTSNPNTSPVARAGNSMTVISNTDFILDGGDSYDPNGTIVSWSWSMPGAVNSTVSGVRPTNRYSALGNYTVTLTVTDNEGGTGSTNIQITVTTNVPSSRFDPRQETIYFLLTARWFDGDTANSSAEEWCSYTPARAAVADHGFTGPEDVPWRGDFKGLVEKMDYIKALGFTTIWLTPVVQNRGPLTYHGYHGWDFTKEDRRLTSAGYDFQRVIDEAHLRGMKICLDIVINHSGRMGIKNFAEIKYNTDPTLYPQPDTPTPGWEYDGLSSPGTKSGIALPAWQPVNVRPFDATDIARYPYLATDKNASGFMKYQWPCTESYVKTIDGAWETGSAPADLTYEGYKASTRRMRGHGSGFDTGAGSFDNYPQAHFDTLNENCPDLNTENADVQTYLLNAYYRYIDMGVDMFRVDTVQHIHKTTLNTMYWPQLMARANNSSAKARRGGGDFFMFGEVANFVMTTGDKEVHLRQQNYTWDDAHGDGFNSANHKLNGNSYRTTDYSTKSPNGSAPYNFSVIDMVGYNQLINGAGAAYNHCLNNDQLYNDASYLVWYADSHDYGPNKSGTRYAGAFEEFWSMAFTFRGIPVVYYGSEIRFQQGKPIDWPTPGSGAGTEFSLEVTGRAYYGPHLAGTVTATGFGDYTASGQVATTLDSLLSRHLRYLNKIRQAVPALQMGQYSTDNCGGGMASFKRRFTGTVGGKAIDSFCVVGVGGGSHTYSGLIDGKYIDAVTGDVKNVSGGSMSFTVPSDGPNATANLRVYVLDDLTTRAPGRVITAAVTDYIH